VGHVDVINRDLKVHETEDVQVNESGLELKVTLGFFLAVMGGQIKAANLLLNSNDQLKMKVVDVMQRYE
jgi:hypothetical protein